MATIKEKLSQLGPDEKFYSFEFFPPKTDGGFRNLLARLHRMLNLNPLFVTVTWGAGGSTSEKSLELAATCQKLLSLTTVLHLTCTNTNKVIIDNALVQAKKNGIRNILALRGDPPRTQEYWTPDCEFSYAVDLVEYIKQQYGDYFCIGVAGYPEGHVEGSDNSDQDVINDIPYLEAKVKAGADFIITQLFFDAERFLKYDRIMQSNPLLALVPLIPGLMPITTLQVFSRATKLLHASVPQAIHDRLHGVSTYDDGLIKKIGVDILVEMIDEINRQTHGRIKGYHFYCLNLEKAVASIVNESAVLQDVVNNVKTASDDNDNEDVFASDEDDDRIISPPVRSKSVCRRTSINENAPLNGLSSSLADGTDKRVLVDISKGKGVLGKEAIWDDFPNGRFGDSNSPAYGEIDGYGPTLKITSHEQAKLKWGEPQSAKDIITTFVSYLSGKIETLPWVDSPLSAETALIQEELFELNHKGWFLLASQPAVDGCLSTDRIFGWGPKHGLIYQKAFVEIFIPKTQWNEVLKPKLQSQFDNLTMTYYLGDCENNVDSNIDMKPTSGGHTAKNAVTWGVFPSREVLQPTLIDLDSFKAWNEEAFILWKEWARCYKRETKLYELLNTVFKDYYLLSLIHHDFKDEYALWNALLGK